MTKPSCCKAKTTHTTMTSYDKRVQHLHIQKNRARQAHCTTEKKLEISALRQHTQVLLQQKT